MGNKASSVPFVPVTWCDGGGGLKFGRLPYRTDTLLHFYGLKTG